MSGKPQASRSAVVPERRLADATAGRVGERAWASAVPDTPRPVGARHSFGDLRVTAGGTPLVVGKPDDIYEIEAERAADRALADGLSQGAPGRLAPARPGLVQRRASANAGAATARDLPQQLGSAATEARPLPAAQRTFFEQRLGHDFGSVRVHDGPASAAAAASVGAQAFAHGQNVYFGAGEYRPDSRPGQWLIAHELAHTVQQRPNVIARRAMEGADSGAPGPIPDAAAADPRVDEAADALSEVSDDKAAQRGPIAQDKLRNLDTPSRIAALARVQSNVPPAKQQEIAGRLDVALGQRAEPGEPAGKGGAKGARRDSAAAGASRRDDAARQQRKEGEAKRGVELQSPASAAPAPTQPMPDDAAAAATPTPHHERAMAAAATKTKQAIQLVSAETPLSAEGEAPTGGAGSAGPSAAADKPAAATGAQAAAGEAMALMSAQLAQLGNMRGVRPRFQMDPKSLSRDPREALRRQESDGLAAAFVDDAAKQVEAVIAVGAKFPAQALASLADAKGAVAAAAAAQIAAVREGAGVASKKVAAQSTRAQAIIEGARAHADGATEAAAKSARERAKTAYDAARKSVKEKGDEQTKKIDTDFVDAARRLAGVGLTAEHQAWLAMEVRKRAFLSQKNGESTILDGPYHDDQCDARAEAAEQVHEEYKKSFLASAKEQADKLPAGKPEVLGQVTDVAKKLDDGLGDQFKKIGDSVDAFEKGGKAQARQTAAKIRGSVAASAAQSTVAIDKTADEQTQQIAAQSESQQNTLDQAAQSALASVAGGVTQACGQMIQSIGSFIASAAGMPPPGEELAPTLARAAAQAAGGVDAMRAQLETAGPMLAANLDAGAQSASEGLAAAAVAVRQSLDQTADAFAQSAAGMSQQAGSGFRSLTKGNEKTAQGIAESAERGFKEAQDAAAESFKLFSKTVQDTFATGRQQLFDSLWSQETQKKLDQDITDYAEKAADQVQPRWKKVLKWVITIVVVLAVIAITIASAGSLGPVGVVLLGAALGAAAGAVQTIANNLIDGKKWSDGVVKAMIVGAVSGLIGGAGGALLKGAGSLVVKIGGEALINIAGGVAAEAVGSAAVGDTFNFESALVGALIGAGIGAGLGIAGALKGKIRFGSVGGEAPAAPPRPTVEPPVRPAPGKVRSFLEQAKILAPRPGAPTPEINVGSPVGGDVAPPAPGPSPKPAAGAPSGETGTVAPEPAPSAPRRKIGFGPEETIEPKPDPAPNAPRRKIGYGPEEMIEPKPDPAPNAPRRKIGYGPEEMIEPKPDPAPNAPRRKIGFGPEEMIEPKPDPAPNAPRRAIGVGNREPIVPKAAPAGEGSAGPTDTRGAPLDIGTRPRPGAAAYEPSGAAGAGGNEPIRAGGRSSLDVEASSRPGGKGPGAPKPAVPERAVMEPTPGRKPAGAAPAEVTEGSRPPSPGEGQAVEGQTGQKPGAPRRRIVTPRSTKEVAAEAPQGAKEAPAETPQGAKEAPAETPQGAKEAPSEPPEGAPAGEAPSRGPRPGAGAEGEAPSGTNKPKPRETGAQMEKREFAADRASRPPKGRSYFDYEGGNRGSFRSFAKGIASHFKGLAKARQIPAAHPVNASDALMGMEAEAFISSKPGLNNRWNGWGRRIATEMDQIRAADPKYMSNPRFKQLAELNDQITSLGKQKLGDMRPDLVEVFPDRLEAEITDITQKVGDPFHRFKTEIYMELVRDMLPGFSVTGNEYGGALLQDPIP